MVKGLKGKRSLVVAVFGECEKVCRERPIVIAKVVNGKRPFSIIMSDISQRRYRPSQSASAQVLTIFAQAQRPASGGQPA